MGSKEIVKIGVNDPDVIKEDNANICEDDVLNFSELKPGEYSLHVYVERTRCLVHPENDTELVDPMIVIKSLGKNHQTQVKPKVGISDKFWGEHLYIEKSIERREEIRNGKLLIEVIDYNTISKNCLIGNYEMDLASIYLEKERCLKYKWLALTNVKKNFSKIMGYIKVSVSLMRGGEKQVILGEEPVKKSSSDSGVAENQVMLPPQLQQKPGQIIFQIFRAESLKKMDTFYSIDAYCTLECGGYKIKTQTVMDNKNPSWYQDVYMPLFLPTVSENLKLQLWDFDRGSVDELVGSCNFKLKQIMSGEMTDPFWCNIYGSPFDCKNKDQSELMNNNPDLATYWCGRILVSVTYRDSEDPQCMIKEMNQKDVGLNKNNDYISYGILVDAFYGLQLPEKDKKYSIIVRWADFSVQTRKIEANNGLIEWFERVKLECKLPYRTSWSLPDLFIYLTDSDGKCISYIRENVKKSIAISTMNPRSFFLLPDRSVTDIRSDEAGIINATVLIQMAGFQNLPNPLLDACKLRNNNKQMFNVNLYQCQDLTPGDSNGTSDPFVEVSFYGNVIKFPVKDDTNNPIWYKSQQILVPQVSDANPPPILIRVFDEDTITHDFLGSALVDVNEGIDQGYIGKTKNSLVKPQWIDLKFNRNSMCGKILISFQFDKNISQKTDEPLLYDLKPKLEKFRIQVKILGLRNLKSYGPMPVRRPFIKFDVNSLKGIGDQKNASKNIFTEPKGFGNNPTISTIIQFDCLLPQDMSLFPSLSCTVYDKILFGLVQPIIGQFSINLNEFAIKTKEKYKNKLAKDNLAGTNRLKTKKTLKGTPNKGTQPGKEVLIESKVQLIMKDGGNKTGKFKDYQIYDASKKVIIDGDQINQEYIIFWANYEIDNKTGQILEINPPDSTNYFALSFDNRINKLNSIRLKETGSVHSEDKQESTGLVKEGDIVNYTQCNQIRKHYRFMVEGPLEKSIFIEPNVFDTIEIQQQRRFNANDMFNDMVRSFSNFNNSGKFKGSISVVNHNETNLLEQIQSDKQEERDRDFLEEKYVLVRIYILEAANIPNGDELDESDPYLIIKLGNQEKSTRKRFIKDNSSPKFNEMFEFKTCLPGDPNLKIQLWDYDELSSDDFLCETIIDLEDRFYSKKWRKLVNPPIESRPLFHPSSSLQKGDLKLWIEIIPGTEFEKIKSIYHISSKPSQEFELRCVIWEVSDIPAQDIEDTSDLFVVARVGDTSKQTDVHYRSQNGEGSFNWRIKFPITLPCKDPAITFQVFDKDILTPNDFISSVTVSFQAQAIQAFEDDKRVKMYGTKQLDSSVSSKSEKKFEKIELPMINVKNDNSPQLLFKEEGKIQFSLELVPKEDALQDPVGSGRSEPNHSPNCPSPTGRFNFSWNPYTLFCQLVGPKARAKICFALTIIFCIFFLIMVLPSTVGSLIGGKVLG